NGRMCSPSRAGRRKMTTVSLLSPTPSPVVSARRPPHHGGHRRHHGRRERGQDGTGPPVDASHAGLLLSRRREIGPYNVKSIAPAALFRAQYLPQAGAVVVVRAGDCCGSRGTGTSESEPEERHVVEPGTARTHRGTQRATRRSRTGDLPLTKPDRGETPQHQEDLHSRKDEDPN